MKKKWGLSTSVPLHFTHWVGWMQNSWMWWPRGKFTVIYLLFSQACPRFIFSVCLRFFFFKRVKVECCDKRTGWCATLANYQQRLVHVVDSYPRWFSLAFQKLFCICEIFCLQKIKTLLLLLYGWCVEPLTHATLANNQQRLVHVTDSYPRWVFPHI